MLVVAAALLLIALASHVVPGHYGHSSPPRTAGPTSTSSTPAPTTSPPPTGRTHDRAHHFPLSLLLFLMLVGLLVVGAGWGLVGYLVSRFGSGRRERPAPRAGLRDALDNTADLTRRVAVAVDSGLDEIAQGPVSEAIIVCWLRLAEAAESSGVTLRRSDTPAETVVRVLGRGPVRVVPLRRLADLYREARFSTHEMTETSRDAARLALEQIRVDLMDASAPPPPAGQHDA